MRRAVARAKRLRRWARATRNIVRMQCEDCHCALVQRNDSVRDCLTCAYSISERDAD